MLSGLVSAISYTKPPNPRPDRCQSIHQGGRHDIPSPFPERLCFVFHLTGKDRGWSDSIQEGHGKNSGPLFRVYYTFAHGRRNVRRWLWKPLWDRLFMSGLKSHRMLGSCSSWSWSWSCMEQLVGGGRITKTALFKEPKEQPNKKD